MAEKKRLAIIIPIYNDWQSLALLLKEISQTLSNTFSINVLVVNDASTIAMPDNFNFDHIDLEVVTLLRNLGHQKAISIGIAYLANQNKNYTTIVMDGDGEDNPSDIHLLVKAHEASPQCIIFARRIKRKRGLRFRFLHLLYKIIFRVFTGNSMGFGNFCLVPEERLNSLANVSEIWNHFSGGIIRSNIPFETIPLSRGKRLEGTSKMNLISLVIHGISSISVYLDIVAVRLLVFFGLLIVFSFFCIVTVIGLKLYTDLAIPGWASTVGIGLVLIILQSFFTLLILSFIILSYRSNRTFIPALHFKDYIIKPRHD